MSKDSFKLTVHIILEERPKRSRNVRGKIVLVGQGKGLLQSDMVRKAFPGM